MANQSEVLKVLSTKEEATSPATIATELKSAQATIQTYLSRLKKKDYVEGGGQEWFITDAGRKALERGEETVVTKEDVGQDELSRFRIYGELSGVDTDLLDACTELFQNTDMRSLAEMERVLAELNIPQTNRNRWIALYRGYLRNTTPPEKREELYPLPVAAEVKREEVTLAGERKGDKLDYIVEGNEILRVGDELGMFTFREALQVVAAKRGTVSPPQSGGGLKDFAEAVGLLNPTKPLTVQDVLEIVSKINENRGGGGSGDGPQPQKGFLVSADGEVTELKEGQPIVIKKVERQPAKTYYLNENQELVEQEAGKPIVIKVEQGSPNSGTPAMLPFPVMGGDGQPVLDKDGRPVYANLEPMMKYLGFLGDQRRADERHGALMGLAKTVRENIGDGVAAIRAAAGDIKGGPGTTASEELQTYECGECHTQFKVPPGDFEKVACPSCKKEYTLEELKAT